MITQKDLCVIESSNPAYKLCKSTLIKNIAEQIGYKYVEVECDDFDSQQRD